MSSAAFSGARVKSKSVLFQEAASLLPEGNTIDEDEVIRLAQRYYISPAVVKEAKTVFDRYYALELKLQMERGRMMMIARSSGKSRTLMDPSILEGLGVGSRTSGSPDTLNTEDKLIASEKVSQAPVDNTGSPINVNLSSSIVNKSPVIGDEEKPSTTTTTATASPSSPPEQLQQQGKEKEQDEEEKKDVRLGIEGLQQFFLDLGMAISSLEVADLVHTLNDDPIDFVMQQRNIEAAAAAQAAAETAQMNSSAGKKGKSSPRSATSKKKGKVDGEEGNPNDLPEDPDKKLRPSLLHKKSLRDGVSFSLFLFILSNMLLEEEDNPTAKDSEVSELFHTLDVDKDDTISLKDVQATVERLVNEGVLANDSDIYRLCNMTSVELEMALMECDVNDDGYVTVEDLCNILRS
ncbi:uncharacterized protein TM35_000132620 [Trypanosoma theileri]|uniref:EF-hand domain-containing protein n=1 Tax=Trypanosoma theileri TaxID=67003 RepID=A0A1X0NXJ3_9TRYP|nr:uncharacterized protein TM35_000132620 [Trypanosoma theileri]ORC89258.1 hypothetical protein TM35_000132620 [Trypanosoma theileri]